MYAVLSATQRGVEDVDFLPAETIEARLRRAAVGSDVELIGPHLRTTRFRDPDPTWMHPFTPSNNTNTFAWLVRANGPATLQGLLPRVDRTLGEVSRGWLPATMTAWPLITAQDVASWGGTPTTAPDGPDAPPPPQPSTGVGPAGAVAIVGVAGFLAWLALRSGK